MTTDRTHPANGAIVVADVRFTSAHWDGHHRGVPWTAPAPTVTGQTAAFGSNAGSAVADHRLGHTPLWGVFQVARWTEPTSTIVGHASVRGSNGVAAAADSPTRVPAGRRAPHLPPGPGLTAPGHKTAG